MPSQLEKLQAHASHLLDAFLHLRQRYAILDPMLFDESVVKSRGSGVQDRGFEILRQSLFLSCAQDIAKLCLDDDKRTPSIKKLVAALEDAVLCQKLQDQFANWRIPLAEEETDPQVIAALKRIELQEAAKRRQQFLDLLTGVRKAWNALSSSVYLQGFVTVRDKISAHTEIQYVADKYQLVDVSKLGIKWGDMRKAIEAMQRLVEDLGLLIRNAGFAWDMLDEQLSKASRGFWLLSKPAA